jgi:hypothetical protein
MNENLNGEQKSSDVFEDVIGEQCSITWTGDRDEIGDSKQGNDHQQRFGRLPVLLAFFF